MSTQKKQLHKALNDDFSLFDKIKNFSNNDNTSFSRALIDKFEASTYFNVVSNFPSEKMASSAMLKGDVDVILEIPYYFERDLLKDKKIDLSVIINAIDGATAGVENVYINQIVQLFNKNAKVVLMQPSDFINVPKNISSITSFWYNETLNYKTFMVPSILVLLVTMITLFLSGMNVVREKEIGTLD